VLIWCRLALGLASCFGVVNTIDQIHIVFRAVVALVAGRRSRRKLLA